MDMIRGYKRKATKKDCKKLAKTMREADCTEVMASHGHTPYQALINSYSVSDVCYSMIYKDEVVGMFGITKLDNLVGSPWLLGSNLMTHPAIVVPFLRQSKEWIARKQSKYPMLVNYVHANNTASLKWLKYLGFTFIREVEMSDQPFYEFVRIKNNV